MQSNPTCHLKRPHVWGFEIAHLGVSLGLMMLSNFVLSAIGLPVVLSWALGVMLLLTLRILSIGQKAGHLGFLLRFLMMPRLYIGSRLRARGTTA